MSIQTDAMLVTLNISAWSGRKFDRKASDETTRNYNAAPDAARVNKMLVPKKDLAPVQKAVGNLRKEFYKRTVPFNNNGQHLLASSAYMEFAQKMRELKQEFYDAADEFCGKYALLVQEASLRLGDLYNPDDYPDVGKVRERFSVDIEISPVPQSDHLVLNIESREREQLKAQLDKRVNESLKKATREVWGRLHERVSHMASKLKDEDSIFRDSLVGNIRELVELMPQLNITGDADLARMTREVEERLAHWEPKELRKDKLIRKDVARDAEEIAQKMSAYFA